MSFEIKSEKIESEIRKTKESIRGIIDRLIECKKYLLSDNKICEAMTFSVEGIEQIAKDQLILPMLRALGYNPEYKDNHLEIWSEANIGKYKEGAKTNKRVDYAIFLKDDSCTQPRLIVEAKALAKLDTPRADYESPTQQLQEYYDKRPDAIFLPMLSNGDEYCLFKRSGTDGKSNALGNCNPPFLIYLQDLKDSDEALDLFVRLASKCVINEFTINNATIDDYDNYIRQVEAGLKLRKRITDKLLTKRIWTPEEFYDEYGKEEWQYKNVYERIIIDGDPSNTKNQMIADEICEQIGLSNPNRAKRKRPDDIKKWEKDLFEKVRTLHSELYYASCDQESISVPIPEPIPGQSNGTGTTRELSSKKQDEWENGLKKGYFTQLEKNILDKIKKICGCEDITAVDNEQYITFIIANKDQEILHGKDIKRNRGTKDGKYENPWFIQYGNIIEKNGEDQEHAQHDNTMQNACIALYHREKSMKDLFPGREILKNTKLEGPAIKINSISDFDDKDIIDTIKECFDFWYDKWQGKPSN